jgi:hypothetical protein
MLDGFDARAETAGRYAIGHGAARSCPAARVAWERTAGVVGGFAWGCPKGLRAKRRASGPARAAHAPEPTAGTRKASASPSRSRPMGQGRWRLCGSPPRHKRANGPRSGRPAPPMR